MWIADSYPIKHIVDCHKEVSFSCGWVEGGGVLRLPDPEGQVEDFRKKGRGRQLRMCPGAITGIAPVCTLGKGYFMGMNSVCSMASSMWNLSPPSLNTTRRLWM